MNLLHSKLVSVLISTPLFLNVTGSKNMNVEENIFRTEEELIYPKSNNYFYVGDMDVHVNKNNYSIRSKGRIKYHQNIGKQNIYLTIFYNDILGKTCYLYKNYNLFNCYSEYLKSHYFYIDIDFEELSYLTTFNIYINYPKATTYMDFKFKISNPLKETPISKTYTKIYYSFRYDFDKYYAINKYKPLKIENKNNFTENYYYYSYFDLEKSISLKAKERYAVKNCYLYVDNKEQSDFNNAGFIKNRYDSNFRFFNVISKQAKTSYNYNFYLDGTYFVDPVTNIMDRESKSNYIECDNKIYFPLKKYQIFKNADVGLIFDYNINGIVFKIKYNFTLSFQEHYFNDEVVIYKTYTQVTKDESLKEIKL